MIGKRLQEAMDMSRHGYSPQVAAEVACEFTFNPSPDARLNEAQTALKEQAIQKDIEVNGELVHFYEWNPQGTRKALLVHGIGGRCLDYINIIQSLMSQGFRVIGFDAPSHGFSPLAAKGVDISNFWYCIQRLAAIYGKEFDLACGHSFGCSALTLQMRHQHVLVRNLILFAPNLEFDSIIKGFLGQIQAKDERLFSLICDLTAQRFASKVPSREVLWNGNSTRENLKALAQSAYPQSCLVLHGTKDTMFPHADSQLVASAAQPKPCELHVLEGLGHKNIVTDKNSLQRVNDFCAKLITSVAAPAILPGFSQLVLQSQAAACQSRPEGGKKTSPKSCL